MPLAERRPALADERQRDAAGALARERHRHARRSSACAIASGAAAGRMPQSKSPTCRSLPSIGGPALPICAFRTMRTVSASGRIASATPRSRMSGATTSPRHGRRRPGSASPRRSRIAGRVDRLLPERAESLSLERHAAVAHLAAREERLQPVVGRARQDHAAQDLDALLRGQRRPRSPRGAGTRRRHRAAPAAPVRAAAPRECRASPPAVLPAALGRDAVSKTRPARAGAPRSPRGRVPALSGKPLRTPRPRMPRQRDVAPRRTRQSVAESRRGHEERRTKETPPIVPRQGC